MTTKLLLSLLAFSACVFAAEVEVTDSSAAPNDAINAIVAIDNTLHNSQKITYVKNPCAGKKGYRFSRVRGFGFDRGYVRKFQTNGILSYEKIQYPSLADFFSKRGLCQPIAKSYPALHIGLESLEVWP